MATPKFKIGDRVQLIPGHPFGECAGTVTAVNDSPDEPAINYTVRKVETGREYNEFLETDLEPNDTITDLDDAGQIRAELRRIVAGRDLDHRDPHRRILAANHVALLAARLGWLEADELRYRHEGQI